MRVLPFLLLSFCLIHISANGQTDTLQQADASESIFSANPTTKNLSIDLSSPEDVEITLKKIHTFKSLESIELEGETEEATLKKVLYRLSVLKNLSAITFQDNDLLKMPDNISDLKSLRRITVEGNRALDYNDLCTKLSRTSITEINLIDNDLAKEPAQISTITSLKKLKITGSNQVNYENLIEYLEKLPMLTELAIPVNFITDLPKNITKLSSLQLLDVSNNILTDLPNQVSSLKALNNLSIQGNLLLNPVKDLEKFKGTDIRFLSLDKEVSGEEIEQIKKMFPKAEINFPVDPENEEEKAESAKEDEKSDLSFIHKPLRTGELKAKKDFRILSGAYLVYPGLFRSVAYNFDTLSFNERYENLKYSNVYQLLPGSTRLGGEFFFTKKASTSAYPNKGRFTETWFRFTTHSPELSFNYPELSAFAGMYWVYKGELSKGKFKKKFLKKTWNDVRVNFDKNNSLFSIEVKSPKGFEKFNAYPLLNKNLPIEKSQQTYGRRFAVYQKTLTRRAERFRKNHAREKRKYNANFKLIQDFAWKELQIKMSDDERAMSKEEWLEYYDNLVANEKKALDNSNLTLDYLSRSLTIRGFNTTLQPTNTINNNFGAKAVSADFIDANGAGKLAVASIFTLDTKNKLVWQIAGTLGLAPNSLVLKQFSNYLMLVELRNGNIGLVTNAEIDKQQLSTTSSQPLQFQVKVFDKNLDTIGNLLKEAGLE